MRISDWSSDMCSSDLYPAIHAAHQHPTGAESDRRRPRRWPDRTGGHAGKEYLAETGRPARGRRRQQRRGVRRPAQTIDQAINPTHLNLSRARRAERSEKHTSELQSLMRISYAHFFLTKNKTPNISHQL